MTKLIFFLILSFLLIGNWTKGQYYRQDRGFLLGVNAGYIYPTGDMGKILKNGIGGNLSAKYLINEVIGIGFEAGYHSFQNKLTLDNANVSQEYKCRLIPALLEATFYIPTWNRRTLPYLGIQFGAYITNLKIAGETNSYGESGYSKKLFLTSVGGGLHGGCLIELSDFVWLDLRLRADYVPKIDEEYKLNDDDLTPRKTGFDKMLNIGANVGLLYKF